MSDDQINLTAGDAADTVAVGKGNQQAKNDARSNPRQNQRGGDFRGGDNYFGGGDNQQWLVAQILDHAQQLRDLTRQLDDLPNKFVKLEHRVDDTGERVENLEKLEVVVTPSEILIRKPPDSAVLPMKTAYILFGGFLLLVIVLVTLLYLR